MKNNLSVFMIILKQHNLQKAVSFYKNLGCKLSFYVTDKWAEFDLGGVKIGLVPVSEELPMHRPGFVLQTNDLSTSFAELQKQGVEFVSEPVEALHGLMASFKDPGNNVIDLYQPTPEKVQEAVKKAAQEGEQGGCCKPANNDDDACCKN